MKGQAWGQTRLNTEHTHRDEEKWLGQPTETSLELCLTEHGVMDPEHRLGLLLIGYRSRKFLTQLFSSTCIW